jgi:hypothetical protein
MSGVFAEGNGMSQRGIGLPMTRSKVIEAYFMEHRARLIDIAAFLDRVERAAPDAPGEDFRLAALARAIDVLRDGRPQRARRVLELFSDHSTEPIASAAGMKGAHGAPPPTRSP